MPLIPHPPSTTSHSNTFSNMIRNTLKAYTPNKRSHSNNTKKHFSNSKLNTTVDSSTTRTKTKNITNIRINKINTINVINNISSNHSTPSKNIITSLAQRPFKSHQDNEENEEEMAIQSNNEHGKIEILENSINNENHSILGDNVEQDYKYLVSSPITK